MANQPLRNKTIVLTRDEEKSKQLAEEILALGGNPMLIPLIAFQPAPLSASGEQLTRDFNQFDWLIFTSVNGVEHFFQQLEKLELGVMNTQAKIAVVGEKTKTAIEEKGLHASLLPSEFIAEGLVQAFQHESMENKRVLYIKGNLARNIIPAHLRERGARVSELIVYETICPTKRDVLTNLLCKDIDAITFTSPSTIKHFVQLVEGTNWQRWIRETVVCCIGPVTEKAAISCGIIPTIVPHTYTMDHLLEELILYFQKRGSKSEPF
jgi:uroporphyrinogen-III synthase